MGVKVSSQRTEVESAALGDAPGDAPEVHMQIKRRRMGMWKSLKVGYEELVCAIIRPPRATYTVQDLGNPEFSLRGRPCRREDLQVRNSKGLLLECSWWQPLHYTQEQLPCVVYMHGNSACRLDALEELPIILNMGMTMFAFDFAGCGLSQGEYITLGYHEKDDAAKVVEHLRASGRVSTIALWGRSMGAATALLHSHRDPSIAAMVLDSPFTSLEQVARDLIDSAQVKHKPAVLINAVLRLLRKTIRKRTGLDILKLRPIEKVDTSFIPALIVAGNQDRFVRPNHAQEILDAYAGDKNLVMVDGDHNCARPQYFLDSAAIFFYNRVCVPAGLTEEHLGLRPETMQPASPLHAIGMPLGYHADGGSSVDEHMEDSQLQQVLLMSLANP